MAVGPPESPQPSATPTPPPASAPSPILPRGRFRFRRWWKFAKKHHEVLSVVIALATLLGTLFLSIAAIFVSWRVAQITDDQRHIQESAVLPQISIRYQESEYSSMGHDLVVQNFGGPLNHLQAESWSFVGAKFKAPSVSDTVFGFLPLSRFFQPMALTGHPQNVVARASAFQMGSSNETFEQYQAGPFADGTVTVIPGGIYHLVHLSYEDALENQYDRYIVADRRDFWGVKKVAVAPQVIDSLAVRTQAGNAIVVSEAGPDWWLACARRALPGVRVRDREMLRALQIHP